MTATPIETRQTAPLPATLTRLSLPLAAAGTVMGPEADLEGAARDYARVAAAIRHLERVEDETPALADIAEAMGLSPFHAQRVFTRYAGVSPKRFLGALRLARAKRALADGVDVLDAALDAGLSGPGRLHDLFIAHDAVTPGEFKRGGAGLNLRHGFAPSPFGEALFLMSDRGLAGLAFADAGAEDAVLAEMAGRFPGARLEADPDGARALARRVFAGAGDGAGGSGPTPLVLDLRGTNFQIQVWRALLALAPGETATYGAIARAIGAPGAARAVGSALALNPIAWIIPCHRVLRAGGALGGYEWGETRKRAMLAIEGLAVGGLAMADRAVGAS